MITAFHCPECGHTHQNTPGSSTHLRTGDYCPKCARQITEDDWHQREAGEDWPWEDTSTPGVVPLQRPEE